MGLAVPLPLFNRNQGNILRARLNVSQTQAELQALEDKVVYEVRQAERQYTVTRAAVARIERPCCPGPARSTIGSPSSITRGRPTSSPS